MSIKPTDPVDVLARTVWGEARGEPPGGMEGVASVVVNRATHPRWWGSDVVSVCLHPWQFSCWDADDPNEAKLHRVTAADPMFRKALAIATMAVRGELRDSTRGSDSYADLRVCAPDWATPAHFACKIGNQTFYRIELLAPAGATPA